LLKFKYYYRKGEGSQIQQKEKLFKRDWYKLKEELFSGVGYYKSS